MTQRGLHTAVVKNVTGISRCKNVEADVNARLSNEELSKINCTGSGRLIDLLLLFFLLLRTFGPNNIIYEPADEQYRYCFRDVLFVTREHR